MSGHVFAIAVNFPEHWDVAKEHGFWDISRRCDVQPGELVMFWQTGPQRGARGLVMATTAAEPLDADASRPWSQRDTREYSHRVHFRLLAETPRRTLTWPEVKGVIGSGANPNIGAVRFRASSAEERLRRIFGVTDAWTADLVGLAFPPGTSRTDRVMREIALRRRQATFRDALLQAYGMRCLISECTVSGVLEAAHITPWSSTSNNSPDNGLLLRADVHTLFDLHLLTVTPKGLVQVAPTAARSAPYDEYHGLDLRLRLGACGAPPSPAGLRAHNERCTWLQ